MLPRSHTLDKFRAWAPRDVAESSHLHQLAIDETQPSCCREHPHQPHATNHKSKSINSRPRPPRTSRRDSLQFHQLPTPSNCRERHTYARYPIHDRNQHLRAPPSSRDAFLVSAYIPIRLPFHLAAQPSWTFCTSISKLTVTWKLEIAPSGNISFQLPLQFGPPQSNLSK
ncbi:hypothetical protein BJ508DRAFT_418182 [Ascobolus immersus RN42]|uniref:Uncharacterized protein n=1 Tax=Ascobolus immersus RN42 TaxID=1160509 RepID=A0A3N4HU26_ASCIM|nr:hypothetical protein BJ508DRAFT_418182 [Ascobolus immersus RN42]